VETLSEDRRQQPEPGPAPAARQSLVALKCSQGSQKRPRWIPADHRARPLHIAFAVGVLSRFMSCPEQDHMRAAKGVLRYLRGITRLGVVYGGSKPLQGFVDAD